MKRAHFFSSTFVFVCLVFLHDITILINLVFELLKRCREYHVIPCMNQKKKYIGQFVKLYYESNADGLRAICLSLVCTKGQGLTARLCPECPRFLTCVWGLHTVYTSWDVTQIRLAITMRGSSGQSYIGLARHGFLFVILQHGPFSTL